MASPIIISKQRNAAVIIIGIATVGGLGFLAYREIKKYLAGKEAGRIEDPATQLASRIRTAVNPSGVSWLINTDFTDNASLFNIANEINIAKNFNEVAKSYKKMYGESLEERLRTEFNSIEYSKFFDITKGITANNSSANNSSTNNSSQTANKAEGGVVKEAWGIKNKGGGGSSNW